MAFTLRDNKYFGKPKAEMTVTSEGLRPGKAVTSPSVPLAESVALTMCVFTAMRVSASPSPRCACPPPSAPDARVRLPQPPEPRRLHVVQAPHRPLRRCASSAAHVRGASRAYAARGKFPKG